MSRRANCVEGGHRFVSEPQSGAVNSVHAWNTHFSDVLQRKIRSNIRYSFEFQLRLVRLGPLRKSFRCERNEMRGGICVNEHTKDSFALYLTSFPGLKGSGHAITPRLPILGLKVRSVEAYSRQGLLQVSDTTS